MKSMSMATLVLMLGSMAFAQGTPAAKPEAAPAMKKVSYKEAKKECKSENKALKGADLKKCIDGKQGK